MELPPQPKPENFYIADEYLYHSYYEALSAWERVCLAIIKEPRTPRLPPMLDVQCTCAGVDDGWHSKHCAKRVNNHAT